MSTVGPISNNLIPIIKELYSFLKEDPEIEALNEKILILSQHIGQNKDLTKEENILLKNLMNRLDKIDNYSQLSHKIKTAVSQRMPITSLSSDLINHSMSFLEGEEANHLLTTLQSSWLGNNSEWSIQRKIDWINDGNPLHAIISLEDPDSYAKINEIKKFLKEHSSKIYFLNLDGIKCNGDILKGLIGCCTELKHLSLPKGDIYSWSLSEISREHSHIIKGLVTLRLSNCKISSTSGGEGLAKLIAPMDQLQVLDVSENPLKPEGMTALAETLKNKTSIESLDVSRIKLGNLGIIALANSLKGLDRLRVLSVFDNNFDHEGASPLAKSLVNKENLQELCISTNDPGVKGLTELTESLKGKKLKIFDVSWVKNIDQECMNLLINLFRSTNTLEKLHLAGDEITDQNILNILASLANHKKLHTLNFFKNRITDTGAALLSKFLSESRSMQELFCSYNSITDAGAKALSDSIKENDRMNYIDLSKNLIKDGKSEIYGKNYTPTN